MKLEGLQHSLVVLSLLVVSVGTGCDRQTTGGGPIKASKFANRGPEDSFKAIIEKFRHDVEEIQIGFVVSEGSSRSTMIGSNKVTYKLVAPASADDRYKAVITVASQSKYSLRRSVNDDSDRDQKSGNGKHDTSGDKSGSGSPVTDLPAKPATDTNPTGPKSGQPGDEVVSRLPDSQERQYELAYDNGRWALVTKLNPDTEKSIQFAFDQALAMQ